MGLTQTTASLVCREAGLGELWQASCCLVLVLPLARFSLRYYPFFLCPGLRSSCRTFTRGGDEGCVPFLLTRLREL